jgi:hypothetical protein
MWPVLFWVTGRIARGDKPTLWGNMKHPVREQFRRAGRDLIWIPAFFLMLALLIDSLGAISVKEYLWGRSQIYGYAVQASIAVWLVRQFTRFWWYQFRTRQKTIRLGKRFLIDLQEQNQCPRGDSELLRR